jgi:hypothetical protein
MAAYGPIVYSNSVPIGAYWGVLPHAHLEGSEPAVVEEYERAARRDRRRASIREIV